MTTVSDELCDANAWAVAGQADGPGRRSPRHRQQQQQPADWEDRAMRPYGLGVEGCALKQLFQLRDRLEPPADVHKKLAHDLKQKHASCTKSCAGSENRQCQRDVSREVRVLNESLCLREGGMLAHFQVDFEVGVFAVDYLEQGARVLYMLRAHLRHDLQGGRGVIYPQAAQF